MSELLLFKMQKWCVTSWDPEIVKYREQQFHRPTQLQLGSKNKITSAYWPVSQRAGLRVMLLYWHGIQLHWSLSEHQTQNNKWPKNVRSCVEKQKSAWGKIPCRIKKGMQRSSAVASHMMRRAGICAANHDRQPLSARSSRRFQRVCSSTLLVSKPLTLLKLRDADRMPN